MGQSLFIVWRESVEALLVIGILHAWLRQQPAAGGALRMLWSGVAGGLGLALLLAWGVLQAGEWLAGSAGEWFQCAMLVTASLLILHMVGWMHQHGRTLKASLQNTAAERLSQGNGIGLAVLAMLAVGREGSETVVFLYGIGNQQQGQDLTGFVIGGLLGFALALLTYGLLQAGSRFFSWRRFFQVSEVLLLLLGGALLMAGLDRFAGQLMGMELPEQVYGFLGDPLWDTSALLDDGSTLGSTLAGLTGYRAMPSLAAVLTMALYWLAVWLWLRPRPQRSLAAEPA
ncbi:FTR1 family protein [Pseudomonas sp. S5(2021)]|jgi:high-affinity iron transporter|uniref:FTR1 family iron permease n=1 Tax=Stutzerimonas balearica DSM 6083 TaxID=1123016 RepID=A0A8D3XYX0_9GAMM|nr:FTR1 family protein [Stutzerimonas balearica]MBB61923.1 FTR1 family iron permease [Pseudomonas sp.]MBZ5755198.1 FTR1 family protein [Pseudomonas sp. S5(2021)]WIX03649.1 FTR1 family protein [Pseudomonas sp. AR5]AJE14304.1 FTR1 family iron permease [Stutzerimonas balearica DSM 6083]MBC7199279.1 FTR1 family protein [Stutzerimonas balearica]